MEKAQVQGLVEAGDSNAAIARGKYPTPDIDPSIAAGTQHSDLSERMKAVVNDRAKVQQALNNRAAELARLDAIEVGRRLRAQRDAENAKKLAR